MKKTIVVVFLTIALLISALTAKFGISAEYIISPTQYIARIQNVFDNVPEIPHYSYNDAWQRSRPEYEDLGYNFPQWQNVEINSAFEVPEAIGLFMNNCITYVRHFFVETAKFFPKLWENIKMTFVHWFTPVTVTFENIAGALEAVFITDDWFKTMLLSFIPLDWQQMRDDNVEIDDPFIGNVLEPFIDEYFGEPDGDGGWRGGR